MPIKKTEKKYIALQRKKEQAGKKMPKVDTYKKKKK